MIQTTLVVAPGGTAKLGDGIYLMILPLLILLLVNSSRSQQNFWASHYLEHVNEEAVDRGDDIDVPMDLSMLVVTRVDNGGLPTGYRSTGD